MRFIWAGVEAQAAPGGLVNLTATLISDICWPITQFTGALKSYLHAQGKQWSSVVVGAKPNAPAGWLVNRFGPSEWRTTGSQAFFTLTWKNSGWEPNF